MFYTLIRLHPSLNNIKWFKKMKKKKLNGEVTEENNPISIIFLL